MENKIYEVSCELGREIDVTTKEITGDSKLLVVTAVIDGEFNEKEQYIIKEEINKAVTLAMKRLAK